MRFPYCRSLLSDLLRKALLDVVVGMARNGDQLVLYIGLEVVKSVFGQETLISIVTGENLTYVWKNFPFIIASMIQLIVRSAKYN